MSTSQNEVRFNDGEAIVLGDLHDAQRFLKSIVMDQMIGQFGGYDGQDGLQPSTHMNAHALCPSARGGYVSPTVNAREVTNNPGTVCQWLTNSAPDGLESNLLVYQLAQDELKYAFAANTSGAQRIDGLFIKLSYDDSQDSQTRDFEDSTGNFTSQTMFKKRRTVMTFQVVQGSPAANAPLKPATPAGYVPYFYALIPNGAGVLTHDQVWDDRLPMRLGRKKVYAKECVDFAGDWVLSANGLFVQNTGTFSGGGLDKFVLPLGLGSDARIVRIVLNGTWATGAGILGSLRRWDPAGSYATPGTPSSEFDFAVGAALSGSAAMGNAAIVDRIYSTFPHIGSAPGFWGNGWTSGFGAESVGDAAHTSTDLRAYIVDASQTDTLDVAFVDVYYLF